MKFSWPPIVLPIATAFLAAVAIGLRDWDDWKAGLLPALSVIAGAVLVRLARGMPFSNPENFNSVEVVEVTGALKSLARSLRGLIFVVLSTMVSLVAAKPLSVTIRLLPLQQWVIKDSEQALSAIIALSLAYAFVRTVQIVQSDISLIDIQSKMLIHAVLRKEAKGFEENVIVKARPMKAASGYGEPLH